MPVRALENAVEFREEQNAIALSRLFCMTSGGDQAPRRARGLATIKTSLGRHEDDALTLSENEVAGNQARFAWQMAGGALRLESFWQLCPATGVLSRRTG